MRFFFGRLECRKKVKNAISDGILCYMCVSTHLIYTHIWQSIQNLKWNVKWEEPMWIGRQTTSRNEPKKETASHSQVKLRFLNKYSVENDDCGSINCCTFILGSEIYALYRNVFLPTIKRTRNIKFGSKKRPGESQRLEMPLQNIFPL